ncbi:unnamed protein product [Ophioblennius macclurei]
MPVKNSVAVERRTDLASLFCMIGRHGPAVALAVIAMVSVVAGFIFYRNVRGKRRKAPVGDAAAAAADGDALAIGSDEEPQPQPELCASTDVSEGTPYTEVDPALIQSGLRIRHRRSPSAEKPPAFCPPPLETTAATAVQDCCRVAEADEEDAAIQILLDDFMSAAVTGVEDVKKSRHSVTDDSATDMEPDCSVETILQVELADEVCAAEKVVQAKCEEDRKTVVDEDREEEENLESTSNGPLRPPEPDVHMSEAANKGLDTSSSVEEQIAQTQEDVVYPQTGSVCFERNLQTSETTDDELPANGVAPDARSEVNEPDFKSSEEVENLCASRSPVYLDQNVHVIEDSEAASDIISNLEQPIAEINEISEEEISGEEGSSQCVSNSPVCLNWDVHIGENYQLGDSEVTQDMIGSLQPPIADTEEVSNEEEEGSQCVSQSPVCPDQHDHIGENGDDHKVQDDEVTPDTTSSLEQPVTEIEKVSNEEIDQKEENSQCVYNSPVSPDQDVRIGENHKLQNDIRPNAISSLEQPIVEIKEVLEGKIGQEEEGSHCVSNSPVCPDQDVHIGENTDDLKLQVGDITSGPYSNLEQMLNETEDEAISHICEKMVNLEENGQVDCADFSKNDLFQEECKVEEAVTACADDQVYAQPLENLTSKPESTLLCSQQDWCHETNNTALSRREDVHIQTTEVTEEFRGEEQLHNLSELKLDVCPPEANEHEEDNVCVGQEESVGEGKVVVSCGDGCEKVFNSAESEEKQDEVTPVLMDGVEQNVADKLCLQEEIASEDGSGQVVLLEEDSVERLGTSCAEEQQNDDAESHDAFGNTGPGAPLCDGASFSAPASYPDTLASSQCVQSDQMQNPPEVSGGAASDAAECAENQISLSFVESQLTQSWSGFGAESGISSMAVSPDLSDALNEFILTPEHVLPSEMDCRLYSKEQAESQIVPTDDDVAVSEDVVGVAPEPCQSPLQQTSQDWAIDGSAAVNEDVFGDDVEDGYHRKVGQLMVEMVADTVKPTDEIREASTEVPVLIVQIDGKEVAEKKEETEGKEEELEKTEISIMEATMDHNEWITDGADQVLPWMSLSTTSFTQIPSKPDPSPIDAHPPLSLPDDTSVDTDIPPAAEISQTDALPLEENLDGSKKVLAVQPMSQNVNVTFRIHYLTHSPHQKLAVTGNHQEMGNWKEFVPLEKAKDGHWSAVIGLPAESHVEWKFVVLDKGGVCRWEECGNRILETGCGEDVTMHKWWGSL